MRTPLVLITSMIAFGCSSPVSDSLPAPEAESTVAGISGCYSVHPGVAPSPDVTIPTLIELSRDPAPGFVEPGRFAVREPGSSEPRAPISSWAPGSGGTLDLVLGGGYTGYSFTLRSAGRGTWTGNGEYFADMGLEPTPGPLPLRLTARSCS
jgi:hypothetical protein